MNTIPAFSEEEAKRIKIFLAAKVASMMGRKIEEGDWSEVYCKAKNIPDAGWSNLHIDVNHKGLGVEFKMLRIPQLRGKPIRACAARRSCTRLQRALFVLITSISRRKMSWLMYSRSMPASSKPARNEFALIAPMALRRCILAGSSGR